jgi:hypothetical protein
VQLQPYAAVRWLAELRDAAADRWTAMVGLCTLTPPDP